MDDDWQPEEGEWVLVWAQVQSREDYKTHPEDIPVRIQSHNEDMSVPVRTDWLTKAAGVPEFAGRCTSLLRLEGSVTLPEFFVRCCLHPDHGKRDHRDLEGRTWRTSVQAGYFEEG